MKTIEEIVAKEIAELYGMSHAWIRYIPEARVAIAAYTKAVSGEAVCKVDASYGDEGLMLAAFKSKSLPVGTLLFAAPQPAATVPNGWKLVPIKVAEEMKERVRKHGGHQAVAFALAAWPDLLDSAPEPPKGAIAAAYTDGWQDASEQPQSANPAGMITVANDGRVAIGLWGEEGQKVVNEARERLSRIGGDRVAAVEQIPLFIHPLANDMAEAAPEPGEHQEVLDAIASHNSGEEE